MTEEDARERIGYYLATIVAATDNKVSARFYQCCLPFSANEPTPGHYAKLYNEQEGTLKRVREHALNGIIRLMKEGIQPEGEVK